MKLIAPENVAPGAEVSVQQQKFRVNRDRTIDVPDPLAKHLIDIGFKADHTRIALVGTGGQTASLSDTLREHAQPVGPATDTILVPQTQPQTFRQQPHQEAPMYVPPVDEKQEIKAGMTEEQKAAIIKADAERVLAELQKETTSGNAQVDQAARDAQATAAGAPGRAAINPNPSGVVDTFNSSMTNGAKN